MPKANAKGKVWIWVILGMIWIVGYLDQLSLSGDTFALVHQVEEMWTCARNGVWTNCEKAGHFPFLQRLPILLLVKLLSPRWIVISLVFLNMVVWVAMLYWAKETLSKKSKMLGELFVLIMISGPFLVYGKSSFGEMLGAFFILVFTTACFENTNPLLTAMALIGAGISKDTHLPFLLLLGFSIQPQMWRALLVGAIGCCLVNGGFNYFRFGELLNRQYLNPIFFVPDHASQLSSFFGLWFSPHGGVLFFWPAFFWFLIFASVYLIKVGFCRFNKFWDLSRYLFQWVVLVVLLGGVTFGLSLWFAPFGWVAWGPRLLLPWLPAALWIMMADYYQDVKAPILRLLHPPKIWFGMCIAWIILSFPQFYILFNERLLGEVCSSSSFCQKPAVIEEDPSYYFYCLRHVIWPTRWALWKVYWPPTYPKAFILAGLSAGIFWSLLQSFRRKYLQSTAK